MNAKFSPTGRAYLVGKEQSARSDLLTWDLGTKRFPAWIPKVFEQTLHADVKALYGRPIWFSIVHAAGPTDLLSLAKLKLCGAENLEYMNVTNELLLALLASRASFYISPLIANNLEIIGKYMAHCDFLEKCRTAVISYPCDPVLAWTSQTILSEANLWEAAVGHLAGQLQRGAVLSGVRGELVAQLLLLHARDRMEQPVQEGQFDSSCINFLKQLLGERLFASLGSMMTGAEQDRKIFVRGKINFRQFPD